MVPIKNIADLPLERWKNGGGNTRTLASDAQHEPPRWRLSVADIQAGGPFSRFEGMDRISVLLAGRDLHLRCGEQTFLFHSIGDLHAYAGEVATEARLDAGPCQFLNVMAARATCRATVESQARAQPACQAACVLVMPLQGSIALGGQQVAMAPGEYLLLRGDVPALAITPLQPDARWVLVRI